MPRSLRSAVELRLREKRRGLPQDLVRAFPFDVFAFERLQPLALVGRETRSLPRSTLGLSPPGAPRSSRRASRRLIESRPTAMDTRVRAPRPSGPHAHVTLASTCWVGRWTSSSLGIRPPTKPVRFTSPSSCWSRGYWGSSGSKPLARSSMCYWLSRLCSSSRIATVVGQALHTSAHRTVRHTI